MNQQNVTNIAPRSKNLDVAHGDNLTHAPNSQEKGNNSRGVKIEKRKIRSESNNNSKDKTQHDNLSGDAPNNEDSDLDDGIPPGEFPLYKVIHLQNYKPDQ